jgi:PAS domain S-box-containing protein
VSTEGASSSAIRVLIAEDEAPLRDALADLLTDEPGMELVAAVGDADQAAAEAERTQPDVAMLDVRMAQGGGPHAAAQIRSVSPGTQIIALSAYEDRTTVLEMLSSGAVSYLTKGTPPAEVIEAIRRAARGQSSMSAGVMAAVVEDLVHGAAERRDRLAALRRSESMFRALLESSPDAIVNIDDEGKIALVNSQTAELFGYERDELLGGSLELLLPDRFRGRYVAHRQEHLANTAIRPTGIGIDLVGRRKNGTEFPVEIRLSSIDTADGRLLTARVRDITDQSRAKEVRRRSEERFADLLESAPDAVVIIDERGSVVLVNQQTERLFGYDREEVVGQPIEILLPERFRERHLAHRGTYFRDPRTRPMGAELELAGRRKDGTEFPVDISLSAIETDEGRLGTAFIRDISARREHAELERDLAQRRAILGHFVKTSEEERRRIAGDIHDDSIQAITAAGMRLQILRRRLEDPEDLRLLSDLEDVIQLSISRLRHLLFELRPPALDNEGLAAALAMCVEEVQGENGTRFGIRNDLHSEPSAERRVILFRIGQEALTNARKHANAKSVDVILAERDGGHLVCVADDGVGFSARAEDPQPGHLGLVAMRERAQLAGGRLRIETSPGGGTTVEAWVPA